uniref:(California timema) hypothetical protein n=1 Tax=Timema californicum TaxID=61474 RepID=A0A7R9P7J9_TIMCA|nr:unnamed protein product [Timema californicum]
MQYLSSRIGSSNHYLLHWAVCIPSGCNSHDLKEFLVDNFYGLGQELQVHVNVRDDMCHYDKKVTFDKWDIIFMSILAVYFTIVIVGTTFSLLVKRRSPNTCEYSDLLLAFSVSENLGKLLSHTPSDLGMDCVFGFKFYSMIMILGGHSLLFLIGGPVLNETGVIKVVRSIANEPFKNNQVFVDTFFLVSGFLLSRLLLVELDKKKRVNLFSFFALRYISTPDQDLNLDLPFTNSLVYYKSVTLAHTATKAATRAELDPVYRILKYLKNILLAGAMVDPMAETPLSRAPSLSNVVECNRLGSNLDLLVFGSIVPHESWALDHVANPASSIIFNDNKSHLSHARYTAMTRNTRTLDSPVRSLDTQVRSLDTQVHTLDTQVRSLDTPVHSHAVHTTAARATRTPGLFSREPRTALRLPLSIPLQMSLRPPPHTPSAPLIPQSRDKVATYMLDKEGDRENKERSQGKQQEHAGPATYTSVRSGNSVLRHFVPKNRFRTAVGCEDRFGEGQCMFQSWYIAADTQLFLISMFLVYTIWRWPTVGKILLFVVIALSLAIPFVITLISRLDPLLMMFRAELEDISSNAFFKNSYIKTHMRGTPYFLGVLLGYLVYRLQQSNKKVPKIAVWFGWILSTFLLISSLFSSNVFYDPSYRYYASDAAVFASLDKLGWSLGSSWIIFACVTKNAACTTPSYENEREDQGPIEMFLTWKPIIPLSRLTYSAFLVNGIVVLHHLGTLRAPTYVEDISLIKILISHMVVTFLLALVLSIIFESPLNAIQKILLRKVYKIGVGLNPLTCETTTHGRRS